MQSGELSFHLHSLEESFKFRFVVFLYQAQALLMYIVYFAKERFCVKHPYQRTVGKLQFNKVGKYRLFWSVVRYIWTRVHALNFLLVFSVTFDKCVAKLSLLSSVAPNTFSCFVFLRISSPHTRSSIVTEGIRTLLFFSQKVLKRKKHKSNF